MNKIYIIIGLLILLAQKDIKSQNQSNQIIGYWFCETAIEQNIIEVYDPVAREIVGISKIDTTYKTCPLLFEILKDSTITIFLGKEKKGKWKKIKDEFIFIIEKDTILGELIKEKLILINKKNNSSLILSKTKCHFQSSLSRDKLINGQWFISKNDTINVSLQFFENGTAVIMNTEAYNKQINKGVWRLSKFKCFSFLDIINTETFKNETYVINNENKKAFSGYMYEIERSNKYSSRKKIKLTQKEFQNDNSYQKAIKNLQGKWTSTKDFQKNDTIYANIYFVFEIENEKFKIEYGRTDKKTNEVIIKNIVGNVEISKTCDYLKLLFEQNIRGRKHEITEYVSITKLTKRHASFVMNFRKLINEHSYLLVPIDMIKE